MTNKVDETELTILRRSVVHLSEQNCNLKGELACAQHLVHELMRKIEELRQKEVFANEMLHQKDFVACKLTEAAAQNFELKTQN